MVQRSRRISGTAVARPTTEVARGGRGVAGAPRCETGSTAAGGGARRGQRWTSARQGEAQAGGGDKGYDDGGGRGGSALQKTNGQQREDTAARCGLGRGSGGSGAGSARRSSSGSRRAGAARCLGEAVRGPGWPQGRAERSTGLALRALRSRPVAVVAAGFDAARRAARGPVRRLARAAGCRGGRASAGAAWAGRLRRGTG
ncbi:uncharacterized protein [Miscanthus floridulus]|uniref:uncharacterized protein n=1 Tax=Miscanthus floridulus TaxID=154761 RepID=UPI0034598DF1